MCALHAHSNATSGAVSGDLLAPSLHQRPSLSPGPANRCPSLHVCVCGGGAGALVVASVFCYFTTTIEWMRIMPRWMEAMDTVDLVCAIFFLVEHLLRLYAAGAAKRYHGCLGIMRYMLTFYALVDLFSFLPTLLVYVPRLTARSAPPRCCAPERASRWTVFAVGSVAVAALSP